MSYVPVIAPIGAGHADESFNINADYVAAEVAGALQAEKLLLLTDTKGIYRDFEDKSSFISTLTQSEAKKLINDGSIGGGMIPKVEACLHALDSGTGQSLVSLMVAKLISLILRIIYFSRYRYRSSSLIRQKENLYVN